VGTDIFKFNYGTRQLLHGNDSVPLIEHMPGMAEIFVRYNGSVPEGKRFVAATYNSDVSKLVMLMRYLTATRIYSPLFGAPRDVVDMSPIVGGNVANTQIDTSKLIATKQMTIPLSDVMAMTVSSKGTDDNVQKITEVVYSTSGQSPVSGSRHEMAVYNIIDLNVSPINVNAMRRDIPLVNIYNYAHTFDSVTSEVIQSMGFETGNKIISREDATSHEVLSAICKEPYAIVAKRIYYGVISNIAHGTTSLNLAGHPKFISDQLWTKCLFGTVAAKNVFPSGRDRTLRNSRVDIVDAYSYDDAPGKLHPVKSLYYIKRERGNTKIMGALDATGGGAREQAMLDYCRELGRLRFDTKIVRNLFFLTNAHRIMLHKINEEIRQIRLPVASDISAVSEEMTGYADQDTYVPLH
jgi:hypothetical protein